jgi:undecaprenyl diphosphate synthase
MLWQSAYTELFFSDVLWPDFGTESLDQALDWYAQRERRFGV